MEREVGGGIGMGNTCKPMAVSFQCMTKSTTIKKKNKENKQTKKENVDFPLFCRFPCKITFEEMVLLYQE